MGTATVAHDAFSYTAGCLMDSLKKRVLERDRKHNTPRQMDATERPVRDVSICLDCRKVPKKPTYRVCHHCGGQLIKVTW